MIQIVKRAKLSLQKQFLTEYLNWYLLKPIWDVSVATRASGNKPCTTPKQHPGTKYRSTLVGPVF